MSAPTLAEWLETHPFDHPTTTVPPDVEAAYHLNAAENVLADIVITDESDIPIPEADVARVAIYLFRNEVPVLGWIWIRDGAQSPQIDLADGHVYLEISTSDTADLAGLYDFLVQLSVDNPDFFYSDAQTDVREFRAPLFIQKAIVNPS